MNPDITGAGPESEGLPPGQDGPDLVDRGYLSLPAEVQEALEAAAPKPNYIDRLAAGIGADVPGCPQELLRLYALLALTVGERVTLENVHDAWATWRCATRPDHPSLVPFGELSPEVQELDRPYAEAIRLTVLADAAISARRKWRPASGVGWPAERAQHAPPASAAPGAGAGVAPGLQESAQDGSESRREGSR